MTDEEISERVALLMGWKVVDGKWIDADDEDRNTPCFAGNATAARDVEAEIERRSKASDADPALAERYAVNLTELVSPDWNGVTAELCYADLFRIAHASARQRCEAALMCLSEMERSDGK
jgi:hypothetical protein